MPTVKTEVTEVATALGMLEQFDNVDSALVRRPGVLVNVLPAVWDRLDSARASGKLDTEFESSFENGRAFLIAQDGLRGRPPLRIEWKGPQNSPGFDFLPADLRVDHVFLISCKYLSKVLANSSPGNLFDRCLADRSAGAGDGDWYGEVAGPAFETFYGRLRSHLGDATLPPAREDLDEGGKVRLRNAFRGKWPAALHPDAEDFSMAVAKASAERWNNQLASASRREEMLWRLLRLNPAPYFVLGTAGSGALRLRIATPWDWRQRFAIAELVVRPREGSLQPVVEWRGVLREKTSGDVQVVEGHVQIRWSHGRFSSVEAKVYLDTPHTQVPGYFKLS